MEKRRLSIDGIMAIVIFVITALIAIDGFFVHRLSVEALKYPIFCMSVIAIAAVFEVCKSIRSQDEKKTKSVYVNKKNFMITAGLFLGYIILMWIFGFIVSSIAVTIAFTLIYKVRRPAAVNICAAIIIIAIYYSFRNLLYIFLPEGMLFDLLF